MTNRRLYVVGPLGGRNRDALPTQGEFLARKLAGKGYQVKSVSTHPNRYIRMLEIAYRLIAEKNRIDVQIHQVFSGPSFFIEDVASFIGRRNHKKVIMVLRGGDLPDLARRRPAWVRRVLSRADEIVAPSAFLARELAWLDLPMRIIPNVIDLPQYPFKRRAEIRPKLLWMRSFYWFYNPLMALQVLRRVREDYPQADLVMAGPDKGMLQETMQAAKQLGLDGHIHFPGFLNPDAKREWADRQDIYLNTNRIDNTPISVLEMAAMGLPVIATKVGGVPDLLTHAEDGWLVPDDAADAMADAVATLIENPDLAAKLSENGRKLAERCSWEQVYPAWQEIL